MSSRDRLVELVQRILDGDYATDAEVEQLVDEFHSGVLRPGASDLIFYWHHDFDHEPTAAEIVDRALAYRPIEL